ncbi:hypothetical protein [Bradyrhizobium liaoningense]|uniref:hypothetical protein n=1 Tax=Bradyrhizobium liaoningense TaxID=43992 RepID=UPI001BAC9EDB|nr:hypothetical protein [Bradyrhizobium liaoningense]MBR0856761.1 hypothetical protein [Bradyrhizobium liaoningense]
MPALRILVDLVGYAVARAVLLLLSLGRIHVEPFIASPPPLKWPGYRRNANGQIELRQAAAGWVGFGICVIVLLVVALLVGACLRPHVYLTLRK